MAELDIIITNNIGSNAAAAKDENKPGNAATSATRDSAVKQTATSVYVHQLITTASNTAKTLGKFATTQYGNFTGNYVAQRKIDNALSITEGLISLGSSVVTGAMAGGWIGALVSAVTYATNITIGQIQSSFQYSQQISRTNAIANYNSQRIGSILTNGNRG